MTLTLVLKKQFYTKGYIYVKYESFITYHSKVMANIKVFADKQTDRQIDRQKLFVPDLSKNYHMKNLLGNLYGWNIVSGRSQLLTKQQNFRLVQTGRICRGQMNVTQNIFGRVENIMGQGNKSVSLLKETQTFE